MSKIFNCIECGQEYQVGWQWANEKLCKDCFQRGVIPKTNGIKGNSEHLKPVRQTSWLLTIPFAIFIVCLFVCSNYYSDSKIWRFGVLPIWFVFLLLTQQWIPISHRKGIKFLRKGLFDDAIPLFEKSYGFFKKNEWIDRYRGITLLSFSRTSFTEMALLNIAFCYGQDGNVNKAIEYYEKALSQFPKSEIAKTSLKMCESQKNRTEQGTGEGPGKTVVFLKPVDD